ncbi:MAG: signal peptide peptidase SppA [Thermoplasmata archaeon]
MRERLAHLTFRGTLRERTVEPLLTLLRDLRDRHRIRGVLFDISSGGGEVTASSDLSRAIQRLDAIKPVVASIGAVGASGAYLAALGARRIVARPESQVGSIGVIYPHLAARELLRRWGIGVEMIHAGRHKDAYQGYRPLDSEEREKLQALVDEGYAAFVARVAERRRLSPEAARALATGEFWTGATALKLGLIDALGDAEGALEELGRLTGVAPRRTVRLSPPRPLLERILNPMAQSLGRGVWTTLNESIEDALWLGSRRR